MAKTYDVAIIGGGHNGLVCAAYLARAGKSVVVLEQRHLVGGAGVTEEIYPGFRYTVCSYVISLLRPEIVSDLDLPGHGLELLPLDGTLTPMESGDYLMRWHDAADTRIELMRHSPSDAEAYNDFGNLMYRLSKAVRPVMRMVPPSPTSMMPGNLAALADVARTFGKNGSLLYDLAELMTMSSADWVERWFETPPLLGTLSASGIIGTMLGPRSPGSAYVMLHHYMGEIDGELRAWGLPRGGMGGFTEALASAARAQGAEIRLEAPVEQILVKGEKAIGVVLDGGEEIRAKAVASSVDPKRTFLRLLEKEHVPSDLREQAEWFKIRGSSGKVNLSLDALPEFTCLNGIPRSEVEPYIHGAISISPSIDHIERAYDDAKYGDFSRRPFMDITIPSLIDPTMAPAGKHVMSIFVQYAPYHLREGTWEQKREAFGDAVIDTLAEFAPNIKDIILHRQVFTPWDMEQVMGLTEGNIFQGELSLDQLFFLRPFAGAADFTTPIRQLYLCGSACHPGGGIMGSPGKLAAERILKDGS